MHTPHPNTANLPKPGIIRAVGILAPWFYPYRGRLALALLAIVVVAGALLSLGRGIAALVDGGLGQGDTRMLNQAVLICLAIAVCLALGSYFRTVLVNWVAEQVITDIRKAMFRHLVSLPVSWFETRRRGDIITGFITDTTLVQTIMASSLSMAARNVLVLLGGLIMVVHTSPKLTLIILATVPVVVVPVVVIGRMLRRQSRISQDRLADLSVELDENLAAIEDVLAFGRTGYATGRFDEAAVASLAASCRRIYLRGLMSGVVIFLVSSAVGFVLWLGGHDLLAGTLTAGQLSAFVFYAVLVASSVGALSDIGGELQRAAAAADRIADLFSRGEPVADAVDPLPFPALSALGDEVPLIRFEGVGFRYPSRSERMALDDISFEVGAGERIAIVGESGAGKSTVFKLLLRLYDPTAGQIMLGGVPLSRLSLASLREHLALVPQQASLFSSSVLDNIAFGDPGASREAIERAAIDADAHGFISELPDGYETLIGEKGMRLSGGQRQRLAIARALLRDAPLLLLDEATASLDSAAEQAVQAALDRLMRGRTTLVIAHRLSTVIDADRIIVMDNGRIAAIGDHDSLLADSRLYHRLASLQFVSIRSRSTPHEPPAFQGESVKPPIR